VEKIFPPFPLSPQKNSALVSIPPSFFEKSLTPSPCTPGLISLDRWWFPPCFLGRLNAAHVDPRSVFFHPPQSISLLFLRRDMLSSVYLPPPCPSLFLSKMLASLLSSFSSFLSSAKSRYHGVFQVIFQDTTFSPSPSSSVFAIRGISFLFFPPIFSKNILNAVGRVSLFSPICRWFVPAAR